VDLDLTPDQEALVDAARAVLAATCSPGAARARTEALLAGRPRPADPLWARAVELGWCALAVPEAHGGLGLGAVEAALLAEELGRALAPGPLLPTLAVLTPALRESAAAESPAAAVAGERLAAVASGACTGTLAVAEAGGALDPAVWRTTAVATTGGAVRLTGEKEMVWEAPTCGELVVGAVAPDGEPGVYLVPAAAATVTEVATVDGSRTFARVRLDGVEVPADRVLAPPGPGSGVLERVVQHATLAAAMDAVGAATAAFEATVAYAREREQFGRPIGSFQAIKHKAADMLVALERARALGRFAALCVAEDDDRRALAVAMAKAAAGDVAARVGRETIQVHGGIGFTWEHDAHLYVRRLLADDALFGTAPAQRARVADLLGV
jgi:alkylation response protein AidB-like acyl-CoA dehydrogenase